MRDHVYLLANKSALHNLAKQPARQCATYLFVQSEYTVLPLSLLYDIISRCLHYASLLACRICVGIGPIILYLPSGRFCIIYKLNDIGSNLLVPKSSRPKVNSLGIRLGLVLGLGPWRRFDWEQVDCKPMILIIIIIIIIIINRFV